MSEQNESLPRGEQGISGGETPVAQGDSAVLGQSERFELLKELCKDWRTEELTDFSAMVVVDWICNPVEITTETRAWVERIIAAHPEWTRKP